MKVVFKAVLFFAIFVITNACVLGADNVSKEIDKQLIKACKRGDAKKVELFLQKGANPNAIDSNSDATCLMIASFRGDLPVVKLLLKYGADINFEYNGKAMADFEGETALNFAIDGISYHKNCEEVAIYLVNHGADIKKIRSDGATYLMIAAKRGMEHLTKLLIDKGIDIDRQTKDGGTALMAASLFGHYNVVKLLLEHGANPNLRVTSGQYKGYTALKLAKEKGYKNIVKLLKQYGAKE